MRAAMAAVMAEAVKDVADVADGMAPATVRVTWPAKATVTPQAATAKAVAAATNAALKRAHRATAIAAPKARTATVRRVKAATAVAAATQKAAAMPR